MIDASGWTRSSITAPEMDGGVEVLATGAESKLDIVLIRDRGQGLNQVVVTTKKAWSEFILGVRAGEFDIV